MADRVEERLAKLEQALAAVQDKAEDRKLQRISRVVDGLGAVVSAVGLVILEVVALAKGVDGTFFMPVVALVAALGGLKLKDIVGGILRR